MQIKSGILEGQVLQRNARNEGTALVTGSCEAAGQVEVRILKHAEGQAGSRTGGWRRAGLAAKGRWSCRLPPIKAGGPYRIEFRVLSAGSSESAAVSDVYVGDVWFLGGQSNMQGCGNIEDAPQPNPMVRCWYMRDEWGIAREPLHFLPEAVDPVHNGGNRPPASELAKARAAAHRGVGPGLFFGLEMLKRTGVPQGLVACAHGGTSMDQWDPIGKKAMGHSLYGAMIRRFRKLGQPVAGMLWYQGCSDTNPTCAAVYTKKMKRLVSAVRRDFGQARLPWIVVQIGRLVGGVPGFSAWNKIQDEQYRLPERIRYLDVVPAVDLELDDHIHISGADHARLAARMARIADRLVLGNRNEPGSIRIRKIAMAVERSKSGRIYNAVRIRFSNVLGGLRAAGRPTGFSLTSTDEACEKEVDAFFKTRLEGDSVVLESSMMPNQLSSFSLHYGLGQNPYVNITDSRDMAVPVFGPVPLSSRIGSPYLLKWEFSSLGKVAGGVPSVTLDQIHSARGWRQVPKHPCPTLPCIVMPNLPTEPRVGIFAFRASVNAARAARLVMSLGSDSPFAVWLNGRRVYVNVSATNPVVADQYECPVALKKGLNDIAVAFDGRNGWGWGFTMRFLPLGASGRIPDNLLIIN